MSFLLDRKHQKRIRTASRKQTHPHPAPHHHHPQKNSGDGVCFLQVLQEERLKCVEQNKRAEASMRQVQALEKLLESAKTLANLNKLKHQILAAKRECRFVRKTVAEFDAKAAPYLELYRNRNLPDSKLASLFLSDVGAGSEHRVGESRIDFINVDVCPRCKNDYVYLTEESMLYCKRCAEGKLYIDATKMTVAYGEEVEFVPFQYLRINHLIELLNRLQVRGTTNVPPEFMNLVMQHLWTSEKVSQPSDITFAIVKKALKNIKTQYARKENASEYIMYCDQPMQVWCKLTGGQPVRLSPVAEEKIRLMFQKIQAPFEKHCPEERKNFLSYPYVMHKFVSMLGLFHLLKYFPLLKSKDKLCVQEEIFEKICKDLGWKFISIADSIKMANRTDNTSELCTDPFWEPGLDREQTSSDNTRTRLQS